MSDKGDGNDQGNDTCQYFENLGDVYSEQRDECNDAGCAAASDFAAAASYYAAAACYSSKKW